MGDVRWFVLTLLLVQVAEPRPPGLKQWNLAKYNSAANGGGINGPIRNLGEESQDVKGRAGLLIYGRMDDLNKYEVELHDKQNSNGDYRKIRFNLADLIKEHYENSIMSKIRGNAKGPQENTDVGKDREVGLNKDFVKFLELYEDNEKSEGYGSYDELEGKKSLGEVISEDEYNDYSEDDVGAGKVPVEDGSVREEFYDEDEKYYDEIEQGSEFDGAFMSY